MIRRWDHIIVERSGTLYDENQFFLKINHRMYVRPYVRIYHHTEQKNTVNNHPIRRPTHALHWTDKNGMKNMKMDARRKEKEQS